MDNIQKAVVFFFVAIGLFIFYSVIMTKLEVMAHEAKAKVEKLSADVDWDSFRYQKAVQSVIEAKEATAQDPAGNNALSQ